MSGAPCPGHRVLHQRHRLTGLAGEQQPAGVALEPPDVLADRSAYRPPAAARPRGHRDSVLLGDGVRLFEHPGGTRVRLEAVELSHAGAIGNLRYRVA